MQLRRGLMQLRHSVTASHRVDIFLKVLTLAQAISSAFLGDFLNFSWRFPLLFHVISRTCPRDFQRLGTRFPARILTFETF